MRTERFRAARFAVRDSAIAAALFVAAAGAIGLVKDGKALAIGVVSAKRVPQLPNLPTVAESGLPGFRFEFC